jgi:hypothetical protein
MYSLIYSFFWLDDIIASVEAMIKAMHLVKQHDDAKLTDIINGEVHIQNDKLAKGDDITESIVAVPKVVVDPRPASIIAFQKAALITFQTWWMRSSDNICGLMMGTVVKNKPVCTSIVADKNIAALISDEKIDHVCTTKGVQIIGLIIAGDFENQQDREVALQYLRMVLEKSKDCSACVFVPGNVSDIYICKHM